MKLRRHRIWLGDLADVDVTSPGGDPNDQAQDDQPLVYKPTTSTQYPHGYWTNTP